METKLKYQGFLVREFNGIYSGKVEELGSTDLKEGEARLKVECSSLNYKNALSTSGTKA